MNGSPYGPLGKFSGILWYRIHHHKAKRTKAIQNNILKEDKNNYFAELKNASKFLSDLFVHSDTVKTIGKLWSTRQDKTRPVLNFQL
jgi:hypothetical protein